MNTKKLTKLETLIELFCAGLLAAVFLYLYSVWGRLPESVPTHFNFQGIADGWGSKNSLITLPAAMIVTYIVLTLLSMFPNAYNYPVKLTLDNKERQYANAALMIRALKLEIIILFSNLVYSSISVAMSGKSEIGIFTLIFFLIAVIGTIIYFVGRMFRLK